jgi:hypothetical protein
VTRGPLVALSGLPFLDPFGHVAGVAIGVASGVSAGVAAAALAMHATVRDRRRRASM